MSERRNAQPTYDLTSKYVQESGSVYLTGLQALVRVPIDQMRADRRAGLSTRGFVSGYPGSPLAALDMEFEAREPLLTEYGIVHRPGLNEELAATAVMGSQTASKLGKLGYDGVFGIWYGKAPGLDRAVDALRHANYAGTLRHGGALAYVGDDPTCKSSTLPSTSEAVLADLAMPTLHPGTMQEVLDFGRHGIALSRASSLWTGIKVVTAIADGAGTALTTPDRLSIVMPVGADGQPLGRTTPPSLSPMNILAVEQEITEVRMPAALHYARLNRLNEITFSTDQDWIGIIAPGHLYYEVLESLRALGLAESDLSRYGIRLLRLGMVHPLDELLIQEFAAGLGEILVVEDKRPRLETLVREALYRRANTPLVLGKRDEKGQALLPGYGAIDADVLIPVVRQRLSSRIAESNLRPVVRPRGNLELTIIPRTPYFCSGCPHNASLRVPEGTQVGAGIGCHSMVSFMAPDLVGTITGVTQMGGEGAQWIGAQPFVGDQHFIQNLGEGTFFHSGEMAVRASVSAGSNITYKILYNRAVAMTGGQHAEGLLEVPQLVNLLKTIGVAKIIVTTEDKGRYRHARLPRDVEVLDRDEIVPAQERLAKVPGVTVLIHDQQCAAEARRLRKRGQQVEPSTQVLINERVCEGCGDCGAKSNCLSVRPIDTEFGSKTAIDQTSCNRDYSCLKGDCPSFVTIQPKRGAQAAKPVPAARPAGQAPMLTDEDLAEPATIVDPADFRVRMPGIGGTGVTTVAQIVGTAALLDGRYVTGMDQTGLAQKGGPVVSDVRISQAPKPSGAKARAGSVDLYLALDLIVALTPANLAAISPDRTVIVGSTTRTPTGRMIGTTARQPAIDDQIAALASRSRADHSVYVDTAGVTEDLFGRSTTANIFALGVAYQLGALPVPATAIERAIELNGVAVSMNTQAFRWGRMSVLEPERLDAARAVAKESESVAAEPEPRRAPAAAGLQYLLDAGLGGELGRLVAVRFPDLIAYQNLSYARSYLDDVVAINRAEQAITPGSAVLAEAVARYLYKLMAYKDEYEVSRLYLESTSKAQVEALAAGRPVKVRIRLHPPALRAMGMKQKIALPPVLFRPAFGALRAMRKLRGTPLDLFGYAHLRRVERKLVADYRSDLREIEQRLTTGNLDTAVARANLPESIRGYEDIKLSAVEKYESERADLMNRLNSADVVG
ncbi:indolepyruvate ferredoxin oxidoreductase family protein [Nocardia sp. NPDC052278]|uniref:indolepyruvate ferredoxin oxidoreductase family protein n=1 Tax=unclassified Nocardia TaxID=2637762 RepID=UPI0036C391B8